MSIRDFIKKLETYSLKHKFVNYFSEGDVYEIMNNGEKQYGSVVLSLQNIQRTEETLTINCNIFYIDRLLEDSRNKLQIWTTATQTLQQILNYLKDDREFINFEDYTLTTFTEKFQDLCAGAYVTVGIVVLNNINECETALYEERTLPINTNGSYDIAGYDMVDVSVAGGRLQYKVVQPNDNVQTITPDTGYYGLSSILVNKVSAIPTDIEITKNGIQTFYPRQGYTYMPWVNANVKVYPNLQTKTVVPNLQFQTITADSSYDGLSSVSVTPIKAGSNDISVTENGHFVCYPPSGKDFMPWCNVHVTVPSVTTEELTQAAYDALATKDPNKIYLING